MLPVCLMWDGVDHYNNGGSLQRPLVLLVVRSHAKLKRSWIIRRSVP